MCGRVLSQAISSYFTFCLLLGCWSDCLLVTMYTGSRLRVAKILQQIPGGSHGTVPNRLGVGLPPALICVLAADFALS